MSELILLLKENVNGRTRCSLFWLRKLLLRGTVLLPTAQCDERLGKQAPSSSYRNNTQVTNKARLK